MRWASMAKRIARGRRGLVPRVERCEDRTLLDGALSSLSGFVYCDINKDGVKQASELPVVGATVVLSGTDTIGDSVAATATTDSTGAYHFTSLEAGTYTLQETPPSGAGYVAGQVTQGTPGTGTTSTRLISSITLAAGVDGQNNDFGEALPAPKVVSDMMLVTPRGPSKVVITFDRALTATLAETLQDYSVTVAVKTRKGVMYQAVGITSASIDATRQTVTLSLNRRLAVFGTNVLKINGTLNACALATSFAGNVGVIPPGLGALPTFPRSTRR